jgi:predicted RNA binding protein YcfA (HicA-like mRNA interferase family)
LSRLGLSKPVKKGSHVKFVRSSAGTVDTVIVPKKAEIKVGTLHSILSQAHIDPGDWDDLR